MNIVEENMIPDLYEINLVVMLYTGWPIENIPEGITIRKIFWRGIFETR